MADPRIRFSFFLFCSLYFMVPAVYIRYIYHYTPMRVAVHARRAPLNPGIGVIFRSYTDFMRGAYIRIYQPHPITPPHLSTPTSQIPKIPFWIKIHRY